MCHITFAPLTINELSTLHRWFLQPHVAYWWPEPQEKEPFYTKWSARIHTTLSAYHTPWFGHIVYIDSIPIGYIQYFFLTAQQCHGYPVSLQKTVGLDFFIGEQAYLGKKLSKPIIDAYLCEVIITQNPHITGILIDPTLTNQRAIHVYGKAGFRKLGSYTNNHESKLLMYKAIA